MTPRLDNWTFEASPSGVRGWIPENHYIFMHGEAIGHPGGDRKVRTGLLALTAEQCRPCLLI